MCMTTDNQTMLKLQHFFLKSNLHDDNSADCIWMQ